MAKNKIVFLILALIALGFVLKRNSRKIITAIKGINDDWDDLFIKYGKEFDVNPKLMKAIAANESYLGKYDDWEPIGGTRGLMHIKLSTAQDYEPDLTEWDLFWNPFSADENQIRVATRHMSRLLDKYNNDERLAVQAYNAGEGRVNQFLSGKIDQLPSTTIAYWDRYNRNYEKLG